MATTTNFGWTTPDDTSLVKDGAAAIRTLGQSIDTSMADLEGGTTGQVLSKASNTDMDFTWVTSDDANAIQNAIVDAKGDLIAATAADTPARLAVGTNGQVLTADSTAATGLKWAAVTSTTGPAFSAYRSTNQTVTAGVWTKIAFNAEEFDTDGAYDSVTNYRFTPLVAGKYLINMGFVGSGTNNFGSFYKNGVEVKTATHNAAAFFDSGSALVSMNGSTDYIEFFGLITTNTTFTGGQTILFADGAYIRS